MVLQCLISVDLQNLSSLPTLFTLFANIVVNLDQLVEGVASLPVLFVFIISLEKYESFLHLSRLKRLLVHSLIFLCFLPKDLYTSLQSQKVIIVEIDVAFLIVD